MKANAGAVQQKALSALAGEKGELWAQLSQCWRGKHEGSGSSRSKHQIEQAAHAIKHADEPVASVRRPLEAYIDLPYVVA